MKKFFYLMLAVIFAVSLSGCGGSADPPPVISGAEPADPSPENFPEPVIPSAPPEETDVSPTPEEPSANPSAEPPEEPENTPSAEPPEQTAEAPTAVPVLGETATGDISWGGLIDGLLSDGGDNSCVSPLSVKLALAMAYNGAEGGTAALLTELFGVSPAEMNAWAAAYIENASVYDGAEEDGYLKNPELRIANSYWIRSGLESEISSAFTETLKADYNAESGKFDTEPEPINDWVSGATNGKIKDILAAIDPAALSYLVNAIYFNSEWVNPFRENLTAPGEFTNIGGDTVMTDMLHGGADGYINTAEFEGVTKRLYGNFVFTAVMPKTDDGVSLDNMLEISGEADESYTSIELTLPKFDFETTVDFGRGSLPAYDAVFNGHGMDGALSENAETGELHISEIVHKTTFTLAEAGIEASAATVAAMATSAVVPQEPKVAKIVFDRPFYFMLTDKNGEVLFAGRVMEL